VSFRALVRGSSLWLLRLSPRDRGEMAYECVGCLAVPFVPDGQAPQTGLRVNQEKACAMPDTLRTGALGRSKAHRPAAVHPDQQEG
jgi:hypothetical protein